MTIIGQSNSRSNHFRENENIAMSRELFGVCGSGTMGIGIAYAAVAAGYRVVLYDLSDDVLTRGMKSLGEIAAKGVEKGKITQEMSAFLVKRKKRLKRLREEKMQVEDVRGERE